MRRQLYEVQRAMRSRRETALRRGVIAVLDIGTTKVACLVLQFVPEEVGEGVETRPVLRQGAFRVIGAANTRSRGIALGEITAMDECERAIRTAIQGAQKMANLRVDHVIVSFSGGRPRSYGVAGEIEVENGAVAERDIGHVLAACDIPEYGHGRDAIHALPVNFALDHRSGLTDPRGQIGRSLAVDLHLVTVAATPLRNVLQCIRRCDLELAGVVVAPYASGLASLVEDEQELGAACVDIGGGATGLSIFVRRQMIYADCVRMGGSHVTSDICQGLQVSMADAERLKTMHGGLVATGVDDREMIELPSILGDWDHDRRQISRTELIGVMRPRVEEILEEVRARLDASGFEYLPSQRIVLTGGSAQIPGLEMVASHILGRQCRVGKPLRVQGLPQSATGTAFATAVGLAMHVSHPQDECWDFEMPADRQGARRVTRALRWFKENW
ncbi:MAG TPA: cell division protein FtsA [Amaricoccus sp.]|uniref:cell division protein FtsA n=1 Tax=Amaricoccus sp. TaxID=1872485 RepID=UPI002B5E0024|nr:cell division protein FtsA [Amaricoccus sp.]HMQ91715.1 cell division protein FtsA [Amaricoccus sp.]HMR52573.1 cell division protein FtsA [Amaricoccus sp.]HMR59268.1 cell division protein FtsA [Amaricoccus sp.]HMT99557.1 cell division protein FtsA [Amaricoccus sp.]